jgi:hypothetical protein
MINEVEVVRLVQSHFPENAIAQVEDLGVWVRHTYRIRFRDRGAVIYKFHIHPEWLDGSVHEYRVCEILKKNDLPAPEVLVVDNSCELVKLPFVVMEQGRGERLDRLIQTYPDDEVAQMYRAVGEFYRRLHSIPGVQSGVWVDNPDDVFPNSPNDYLYENELVQGSALLLAERHIITTLMHQRIIDLWLGNMDLLKTHQPVMVHGSPFPWTIYLEKADSKWQVTRIGAMGDTLWWDAMYDQAFLIDPPFTWMFDPWRVAFVQGYGKTPDVPRLMLYRLLQIVCAVNDVYMQPEAGQNEAWKQYALQSLPRMLTSLENQLK